MFTLTGPCTITWEAPVAKYVLVYKNYYWLHFNTSARGEDFQTLRWNPQTRDQTFCDLLTEAQKTGDNLALRQIVPDRLEELGYTLLAQAFREGHLYLKKKKSRKS
jgi:hypothetical protein